MSFPLVTVFFLGSEPEPELKPEALGQALSRILSHYSLFLYPLLPAWSLLTRPYISRTLRGSQSSTVKRASDSANGPSAEVRDSAREPSAELYRFFILHNVCARRM